MMSKQLNKCKISSVEESRMISLNCTTLAKYFWFGENSHI